MLVSYMNERQKRDRPAKTPGGMDCQRCGEVFIGEEWHTLCAICVAEVATEIAADQGPMIKLADAGPAHK